MDVYSVDVEITTPIYDTEVESRVASAIENLFPGAEITRSPGELRATTHTLDHLAERIHQQAILDTARKQFFEGREGDTFTFTIEKQAAFEGYLNFSVGSDPELGDVHVSVRVNDPSVEEFIDQLAPPTKDGVPIDPNERER